MFDLAMVGTATTSASNWQNFLTILLLVFGLFLILAGLFTAYFGSGKSRMIGIALLVVGVVVGIGISAVYHYDFGSATGVGIFKLVEETILVIVAAVIGALVAIGIFLVAIMKS
ncbi:MAG: hypothetical protein L3K06_07180 [Thermoplasmata archaeon]|nr:hypothetical protein [Thermoplasmata archaeon]MCI4355130.1 hypothetical protein [Thermoplasmata archaeon]